VVRPQENDIRLTRILITTVQRFIRQRWFKKSVLNILIPLSVSCERVFSGWGLWDRGRVRGGIRGEVIRGRERCLSSSDPFLTCNLPSALPFAVLQMDNVATAVVTVPFLTHRTSPIKSDGGYSSVHPLFSRIPALGPSSVRVACAFHDVCVPGLSVSHPRSSVQSHVPDGPTTCNRT